MYALYPCTKITLHLEWRGDKSCRMGICLGKGSQPGRVGGQGRQELAKRRAKFGDISNPKTFPQLCAQDKIPAPFPGGDRQPKVRVSSSPLLKAANTPLAPGLLPQHCHGVLGDLMRSSFIKNKSILVSIWS